MLTGSEIHADGMAYLSDTFMTLASLCEAWPPAAHILIRKGSALLRALGTIFDDLLPGAAKAWSAARSRPTEKPTALAVSIASVLRSPAACIPNEGYPRIPLIDKESRALL